MIKISATKLRNNLFGYLDKASRIDKANGRFLEEIGVEKQND